MSAIYHNGHWYGGGQDIDIQSDSTATSFESGKVPTGDTIESVLNTNLVYNVGDTITLTVDDTPVVIGVITGTYQCAVSIPLGKRINADKFSVNISTVYIRTISGLITVTSGITMENIYVIQKETGNLTIYLHFNANVFSNSILNTPCTANIVGTITFTT